MGSAIREYEDINENLRFWFERAFAVIGSVVFYDLGANDGVFTTSYASRCRWVHAFEPAAAACERLEKALTVERLENVSVHPVGLSDSSRSETLYRYSDDTFNTLYRRTDFELSHYTLEAKAEETITLHRLDEYRISRDLPAPNIMKVDIEGAELYALRGAEHTICDARPFMIVEYSVDNTQNAGYDRKEIADLIEGWDYRVGGLYRNSDTTLRFGEPREDRSVWNLVCVPSEKGDILQ